MQNRSCSLTATERQMYAFYLLENHTRSGFRLSQGMDKETMKFDTDIMTIFFFHVCICKSVTMIAYTRQRKTTLRAGRHECCYTSILATRLEWQLCGVVTAEKTAL